MPPRRSLPHNLVRTDPKKSPPATDGKIDRRVARTRNLLRQALVTLIPEKGYAAITVEDICKAAAIGRSTFYAHYTDKDDLTKRTIGEHLRAMKLATQHDPAEPDARAFAFSRPMFEHARTFRDVHRALVGDAGETMHEEVRDWIRETVRRELDARDQPANVPREFTVHFVVGAFLTVLGWWLDEEPGLPVHEVNAMFQRLAFGGVA